jgi:phosphoribosylaminoimidazole carboxylase
MSLVAPSLFPQVLPVPTGISHQSPEYTFFDPSNTMWNSPKVGILGGGQLGRMLVESCNRLNIQANVLDAENSPAKQISFHDGHVTGSFKEREAVRQLAKSCDVMTAEIEHVDTYALEEVASQVRVEPSWQAIRTIQNKFNQKEHLRKYGIPMADHRELVENTPEELARVGEQLGYPMMLKSKTMAYDGRGMWPWKEDSWSQQNPDDFY